MKTYSSVDTAISLVIIAVLSPNTLPWKKAMGVYVRVCVRLIIFPLHALLADNLITTFSDTLTSRSKIALRNVAHFCQGGGLWDVCVGRYFLPFFFPGSVFPLSVVLLVIYIAGVTKKRRGNEWRRERRWQDLSQV